MKRHSTFPNEKINSSTFKAVYWIWLGAVIGAVTAFLTHVVLARSLGAAGYGSFTSALSVISIGMPLAAFGAPTFLLRSFVEEGVEATRWLKKIIKYISITTLTIISVIIFIFFTLPKPVDDKIPMLILALLIPGQAVLEMMLIKHQLKDEYFRVGIYQSAPHFLRLVLILILFYIFGDSSEGSLHFSSLYVVPSVLLIIIAAGELRGLRKSGFLKVSIKFNNEAQDILVGRDIPNLKNVMMYSAPFGLGAALHMLYFHSGVAFLFYYESNEVAANFSIIIYLLSTVYLLPSVFFQRYMQKHYYFRIINKPESFFYLIKKSIILSTSIGVAIAIIVIAVGPFAVIQAFGNEYKVAASVIVYVAVTIPMRMVSISVGTAMQSKQLANVKLQCMSLVAVICLLMLFLLVPKLGLYGAVWALVVSELSLCLLYLYTSVKYFRAKTI